MLFLYLLLSCVFWGVSCLITPQKNEYMGCINEISKKYFVFQPTVTIFTTNSVKKQEIDSQVRSLENITLKLRNLNGFQIDWFEHHKQYSIVMAENLEELDDVLLKTLNLWNPRALYVFLSAFPEESLDVFVQMLWQYYLINAVIFSYLNDEVVNIYTYFPYRKGKCGTNIKPELIDTCVNGSLQNKINLFPNKIPYNFNGCPIIVRSLVWTPYIMPPEKEIKDYDNIEFREGIEIKLVEVIARSINFKYIYTMTHIPQDWGLVYPNGSSSGSMNAVAVREADIAIGVTGPTVERHRFLDHSYCHIQEYCTWCVPKAQILPAWRSLIDIFHYFTWISMIFMYFFVSILVWSFSSISPKDESSYPLLKNSMNYIYSIFLNISAYETPKKRSGRMVFILWIIFGLHCTIAYQAKLISVLTHTVYEKQMDTVDEMLNANMPFVLIYTLKRYFANTEDWRVRRILEGWTPCLDAEKCLSRIAYQRDLAYFTLKVHMEFDTLKYVDSTGRPLIYCYDNYYLVYPAQFYLTKGFPLRDRIDSIIFRVRDSGLILKWKSDIQWKWKLRFLNTIQISNDAQKPLTIHHLQGVFLVAGFGFGVSILVLIVEILVFHICKRRKKGKEKK